jgi:hypothetical protein
LIPSEAQKDASIEYYLNVAKKIIIFGSTDNEILTTGNDAN